jgi:hypothetical protein
MREPEGGFSSPELAKMFDGLTGNLRKINHASRTEVHTDFMGWVLLGFWLIQIFIRQ